jgi:hypothetical protein
VRVFIGDLLFWGLTGFCSLRGMATASAGNGNRRQRWIHAGWQTTATAKATTTADPFASLRDDKQKASKDSGIR